MVRAGPAARGRLGALTDTRGMPSLRLPLSVLLVCSVIAGCGDGYPRGDAPDDSRLSVAAHVKALNRYLSEDEGDRQFARKDSCHLLLNKPGAQRVIALLRTQITVDSPPTGDGLRVKLTQYRDGQPRVALRLNVDSWIDAVAWRSHFQQLQIECRESGERAGDANAPPA